MTSPREGCSTSDFRLRQLDNTCLPRLLGSLHLPPFPLSPVSQTTNSRDKRRKVVQVSASSSQNAQVYVHMPRGDGEGRERISPLNALCRHDKKREGRCKGLRRVPAGGDGQVKRGAGGGRVYRRRKASRCVGPQFLKKTTPRLFPQRISP